MGFQPFNIKAEEDRARTLIAAIDKGEAWIFDGGQDSPDFGGFIHRLVYHENEVFGTICICRFNGRLRIQLGFEPDLPLSLQDELNRMILEAVQAEQTPVSIWYPPGNQTLDQWLHTALPWPLRGHNTYELTWPSGQRPETSPLPANAAIRPYEAEDLDPVCLMLDDALKHTFADPGQRPFFHDRLKLASEWLERSRMDQCQVLHLNGHLAGFYVRKGAEIDLLAIDPHLQNRGLGRHLLHHALERILSDQKDPPYLYCIESNESAVRFYRREGFQITGHSGYGWFDPTADPTIVPSIEP